MQYEVVVPIPVRAIWDAFHDAERLAQCIPGLLLDEPATNGPEGPELKGRWKLRVGANTVTYRGVLRLRDAEEPLALEAVASGGEVRGSARVGAEIGIRLYDLAAGESPEGDEAGETRIVMDATLDPIGEGRTAEFGAQRLDAAFARAADLFAAALAEEMAPAPAEDPVFEPAGAPRPARSAPPTRIAPEGVDLWSQVGHRSGRGTRRALRIALPVLGALVAWRLVRGRRRRAG